MKISKTLTRRVPVVVIIGPTAVGKTSIAIDLAEAMNGEIISADSRYYYRGMNIGTAKPTLEERKGIPHYLIDEANPDQTWSLAEFQARAKSLIVDIYAREKLPIVVGGTGQYIRAITQGWTPPSVAPNKVLRGILENWANSIGTAALHQRLFTLDPEAATAIDHRNTRRTIRALEVILLTGEKFSNQRGSEDSDLQPIMIGLNRPREELYQRVDARISQMFDQGLIEEVETLLSSGFSPTLPAMSAIGYRETVSYLNGEIGRDECEALIKRATRIYVRRQANWFKPDDPDIHWFSFEHDPLEAITEVINYKLRINNEIGN